MQNKLQRLLNPPTFPDTEKNLVSLMLHRLLLTVIGAFSVLLILTLIFNTLGQYQVLAFIFLIIQVFLFALLRTGRTRLVNTIFMITSLAGLLITVYLFGGVISTGYSAFVILIIIAAFTSTKKVYPFLVVGLAILVGGLLILAEFAGRYHPIPPTNGNVDIWVGESLVFILSASLLIQFGEVSRASIDKVLVKIEEQRGKEETLKEQTHYLEAVHEMTLSVLNRLEIKPLLESILTHAEELVETDHSFIDVIYPGETVTKREVRHGIMQQFSVQEAQKGVGLTGIVWESGKILYIDDYQVWENRLPAFCPSDIHAIIGIPLEAYGKINGVLGMMYTEPDRVFKPAQVDALKRFAELAAIALDNAILFQSEQIELTERKRTEEILRRSEAQLKMVLEGAELGIWEWDLVSDKLAINERWANILGYTMAGIEPFLEKWRDLIHPDDLPRLIEALDKHAAGEQDFIQVEYRMRSKSGEWIWVLDKGRITQHDSSNLPTLASGIRIDINNRKLYEEAVRDATLKLQIYTEELEQRTEQLMVGAQVSRTATDILEPDELSQRVVDLVRESFSLYFVGLFLLDETGEYAVLHAGTGGAGRQLLRQNHKLPVQETSMVGWTVIHRQARIALDVGEDAVHFDNPLLPETRSEVTLPLISRGECIGALTFQSISGAAFTVEDITVLQSMSDLLANAINNARLYDRLQRELVVRKQTEAEVRKLNTELEIRVEERTAELKAANRELEAFSYSVSHDLRAPLRAMDGFSRILARQYEDLLDNEGKHLLNRVRQNAEQMSELIDDMLRLSRITRAELHITRVDLTSLVLEILESFKAAEPDRQVIFDVVPGLRINADERLLRVALENLLGNAWKFTGKSRDAHIWVGVDVEENEPVFHIKDNGVGFNMEYANKLFGPFQRLHSVEEFPGTGIGLAIVQRIFNRHGGRIWAESKPGEGAVFFFTLP